MAMASQISDKIEPSQTTEPSDAASSTSDRTDSFSSSPNLARDVDLQPSTALRSEEYRQLFRLPSDEVLVQDFNCAFQESILLQGHMYMFIHYICFYSNIFGFETKKVIPFHEVTCVRKAKTAGIFPNAIEILAGEKKYFFASFLSRDEAFNLINDGLLQHRTSVEALTDQQEPRSASQGNEIIEIENISSSKSPVNEFDSIERNEDIPIPEDSKLLNSVGDATVPETLLEGQENVEGDAEAALNSVASSSGKILWKQEVFAAPKIPEYYAKIAESKFPIEVEEFFTLFFSDGAVNFFESYHRRCGDKDIRCTSWYPHEKFGQARDASFRHPIKLYLGAKYGSCQEAQKFKVYRNSHLVIETSQEISDAPYGDYFRVEGLWDVERDVDETGECCILRVYVHVAFSKKTMFRGKIEQATAEECREAYTIWINNAHELLKQKKLEKQEEVPPMANMTWNDQAEVEMQVKSVGPSGLLHEASDQIRNPETISDSKDICQGIDDSVQRRSTDATSLVSLLGEFVARLCSSLKRHTQISLLLVAFFAVILLMQLSILVLLSRPQEVHVISQADYMSAARTGLMDQSPETVAWLDRQIHHLKDELFMVESRLEKMRQEHSLLKAQMKDLEQLRKQR